jgi:hypothetical protein
MDAAESLAMRGHLLVELFDAEGKLKDTREVDNLIVTVGKNLITDNLLASPTLGKPTHMAVGTGATAPAAGDTTLGTESARVALTSKTRSTNVLTLVGDYAAGTATATLTEAGVFDASSAGNMSSRATFTGIAKGASDTLKVTWTYTIG